MTNIYNLKLPEAKSTMLFWFCVLFFSCTTFAAGSNKAAAFQSPITGTITSKSDGLGLPGATIMVKGTQQNTTTDIDGKFSITVSDPNAVLVISFMGFKTQEIPVAGQTDISITLEEDVAQLDEVVVVGYGTQRKGDVTSAVATVKAENFNQGQVKDAGQLIQGKVAGLAITNTSGDPTAVTSIKLRGNNTLNGAYSDPLVLIDGIPGSLNTVAPEDIESIDVLKDGSAAAIYGTRGTNGVVLITTKKAKGGEIDDVQYTGYVSTSRIASKLDMLSSQEFRELYPQYDNGNNVDWLKEISRKPVTHVHNLSLRGGSSKTSYAANINYNSQQGIMLKSDNVTFRGRVEVNHRMFDDKLMVKFSVLGRENKYTSTTDAGSFNSGAYWQALRRNPTDPIYNADGTYYQNKDKLDYVSPIALLNEADGNVKTSEVRYNSTLTYNPIKDLTLNALFSYVKENRATGYSETLQHSSATVYGFPGYSSISGFNRMEKQTELTAKYDKTIDKNKFSVLGGYSYIESDIERSNMSNYGFQDDYFGGWHNIGAGSALPLGLATMGSSKNHANLISFFGRLTYAYDDKYLLMASLRHEGASQLYGTNNAWGTFPAVSVGWKITNENFMKNQTLFEEIKLRAGYGVTGSQPSGSFLGVALLQYGDFALVNGQWVRTITPASNPNPNLRWEEKKETNIGVDFAMLKGRLSGSIDVYNRNVDGLLYSYSVPTPPNLYPTIVANGGTMQNRGLEVLVSGVPVQTDDFEWTTTGTYSTNRNKLKSLDGAFQTQYDYFDTGNVYYEGMTTSSHRVQVGQPVGNFYGFKVVDVDADGKWVYLNKNGERVNYDDFTHDPTDRQVLGNGLPKWYASWINTVRYKNFDLSINVRGAFGFQVVNEARMNYEGTQNGYADNRLASVKDPVFGKTLLNTSIAPEFNSYYVEDGDYVKIDNITLGYSFKKIKSSYFKSIRLYGTVMNVLTITGYNGIDPEVNTSGLNPGVDSRNRYPTITSFTFGVQAQF
ncbi:SusC/RagA family TonB-linked outer membrane protein [Flavobacterium subsaxonicum]|uniref:SusC/RagA family TonB-linked outer membrane protein n=1 Tax=Flavobacterium subsaxonicum TaxID=426226 RepID=UPI0004260168|nr:SusC/RagA family TonB-linked outer membrane protein [Flavobacterium subsaxonicum]